MVIEWVLEITFMMPNVTMSLGRSLVYLMRHWLLRAQVELLRLLIQNTAVHENPLTFAQTPCK